ncbi:hypothetical protein J132_05969 [Termitomyces sp. J132]|nr:hypothetical protein J132_05969 [Termitomyces sp. J132]
MNSGDSYDINFCFPVRDLENERLKLTPFIVSIFQRLRSFSRHLISRIQPSQGCVLFAIYDKTKASETGNPDGSLAGVIGLSDTSIAHLRAEVAFVMISPLFQRTHVATNAVGLLLHYALDLPSEGGLGLRRMTWKANPLNAASIKVAERMGFVKEGNLRWDWVLPDGKDSGGNGRDRRMGDPRPDALGRDTVVLGLCWDEWEDFARVRVDEAMARPAA